MLSEKYRRRSTPLKKGSFFHCKAPPPRSEPVIGRFTPVSRQLLPLEWKKEEFPEFFAKPSICRHPSTTSFEIIWYHLNEQGEMGPN